jgi:hypothetical protein
VFKTCLRPHALAMMSARLCIALALVAPLHLLGLPMPLIAGGAVAMWVLLALPLLEYGDTQDKPPVPLTRAVSLPAQDSQLVWAHPVGIQAERQVLTIGRQPSSSLRAAGRIQRRSSARRAGVAGRPGAEDREGTPLTLVVGSGESAARPELHVEPRPEGMRLRIVRGASLAEALLADGFVPDASEDGSWTCTTVDAAGFLARIHHLQAMRVEIVHGAGACGASVGERLRRCLVVSRMTGAPWGSGASRRRSQPRAWSAARPATKPSPFQSRTPRRKSAAPAVPDEPAIIPR